ncbi:hypothetical protein HDU92_000622 [Lobulomyces angularis]|nr:hypothetical protein HDU92_000622 [Lobulomyces angularis]
MTETTFFDQLLLNDSGLPDETPLQTLEDYSFLFDGLAAPMFEVEEHPSPAPTSPPELEQNTPQSDAFSSPVDFNSPLSFTAPLSTSTLHSDFFFDGALDPNSMFPSLTSPKVPNPGFDFSLTSKKCFTLVEESFNTTKTAPAAISNPLTIPALLSALNQSMHTNPNLQEVSGSGKQKSKVGRKRKPRPSTLEGILAEAAERRAKNTEAARKSRERKLERFQEVESQLTEMKKILDMCVSSIKDAKVSVPDEVTAYLQKKSLMEYDSD